MSMTGLPKELITTPRFSACEEESSSKEAVKERFKELLLLEKEEEKEKDTTPSDLVEESFATTPPRNLHTSIVTASMDGCSPLPKEKSFFDTNAESEPNLSAPAPLTRAAAFNEVLKTPSAAPVTLNPEITALFEKMAVTLLFMTRNGDRETTLMIDNPSSLFCGTRITIKEFSTAPQVFNIHIASHQAAVHLFSAHKNSLMEAFEKSSFSFNVHLLEPELEDPLFSRPTSDRDDGSQKDDP
jgi:hypothetical protein